MTMATTTRTWTPGQARYQRDTMVVVPSETGVDAIMRHYVMTLHGAVARTWVPDGPVLVNVALWRPRNLHPQYQGDVIRDGAEWVALTADSRREIGRAGEYLHAEAMLLPLRTRTRSHGSGTWPTEIRRELHWRRERRTECGTCGNRLTAWGACTQPDLHW
jgi:hypothetical protein